uniref:DUF1282 domain-containing protein n=1 Tax=candidate division WOR-3 bacterium TaxID=2052148 RepID=A0A7C4Y6G8_UNCW3
MDVINILIEPYKAFQHIKEKDDWWIPFVILCLLLILARIVSFPVISRIMTEFMQGNQEMIQRQQINPVMIRVTGILSIPIVNIITFLFLSLLVYLLTYLFGKNLPFIKSLDLISYASMVDGLKTIIEMIVILVRKNTISSFMDMRLKSGLDLFFHLENKRLMLLLSKINIFTIWFYVLIALGISYLTGMDKKKSTIIAIITFIISLLFNLLRTGRGRWF